MINSFKKTMFNQVDINDPFFDSLKNDYPNFIQWFLKKNNEYAYIQYNEKSLIEGFIYFKLEYNVVDDVEPKIYANNILKIGTFKINPHGTRLGERFIKKALDYAIYNSVEIVYVTAFQKHYKLIELFKKYGFIQHGIKNNSNATEIVLCKNLKKIYNDIYIDYPLISLQKNNIFLISIYPKYHTNMFPDSKLNTESIDIIKDVSYTNSIHKTYVGRMCEIPLLKQGDILVVYRTSEKGKCAEYSSVATSVCVVENVISQEIFKSFNEFYKSASKYSIFNENDLRFWYNKGGCFIINMTYNIALPKRLTRKTLCDEIGLNRNSYYGLMQITQEQLKK